MDTVFITYIFLLLIISILVMVAYRLKISYPIVLVLGGLFLSFVQVIPPVEIDPELIFVIFLPPLLYEAAWQTSWKDFWKWRRIIFSFAFIIVIVTSCLVAYVSSSIIPGFTLALGFLLGGIVSPPDAVSATTIMKDVDVPKRISAIIEGESLLNDASSIIVFRFALAAVATGSFAFGTAAANFVLVIFMGIVVGLAVALVFYALHRWLPTTPSIDIVLTFVSPYMMYILAERFHFSGVLAVVSGGLFLSSMRQTMLSPLSRIQGVNVWSIIGFVLNGLVFMLIGLQLPVIVQQLGGTSIWDAIKYSLIIAFTLIVSRMLIALCASVFTMVASKFITTADNNPGFRAPLILGWAGMRGVVSLAAALSIPLYLNNEPFPQRNLILFITFSVILITLVFQGLTLPMVIRLVNLKDPDYTVSDTEQEIMLRKKIIMRALDILNQKYQDRTAKNYLLRSLKDRLENELVLLDYIDHSENLNGVQNNSLREFESIYKEIISEQRDLLQRINKKAGVNGELIKKYMLLLDHEEEQLRQQLELY
jgi:Na+/H+ antiporter